METYSPTIIKAYNNWMDKIDAERDNEWDTDYRSKRLASKRAGDKFESLCKMQGLNYIIVARDLSPNKI